MTRLIGPDEASREVKAVGPRGVFYAKADRPVQLWADAAATIPADVLTLDGAAIPASTVTIDAWSMLPLILFPNGVDVVYGTCDGGPAWPIYARTDDRLDALGGRVGTVEGVAAGLGNAATRNVGTTAGTVAQGDDARITGAIQQPVQTDLAEIFVTTRGNDSNNGFSVTKAKATIQAAIAALPANGGVVRIGYGTFNVASQGRFDTCGFTTGSTTVTDASVTAADVGKYVIAQHVHDEAAILSVTPGVSFVMSIPANGTGSTTAMITTPALEIPGGVKLRGVGGGGSTATIQGGPRTGSTTINDTGTGVTIMINKGSATQAGAQTTTRVEVEDLLVQGSVSNMLGLFATNTWYVETRNVTFQGHGIAGLCLSDNMNSSSFRDTHFISNGGSAAQTKVSGGVLLVTPHPQASSAVIFDNCFFTNNFGWGIVGTSDWTIPRAVPAWNLLASQFNLTKITTVGGSGTGAFLGGDWADNFAAGCWFEYSEALSVRAEPHAGAITFIGCQFNGANSGANNAYGIIVQRGPDNLDGSVNAIGCNFENCQTAGVQLSTGSISFTWQGCGTRAGITTFVVDIGGTAITPLSHAKGSGTTRGLYSKTPVIYSRPNMTYGTTVTPNLSDGEFQRLTVSNGTAFTMAAPVVEASTLGSFQSSRFTMEIRNTSGGPMGAISWNATYAFNGFTWANPAPGMARWAEFAWNGGRWVAVGVAAADYTP